MKRYMRVLIPFVVICLLVGLFLVRVFSKDDKVAANGNLIKVNIPVIPANTSAPAKVTLDNLENVLSNNYIVKTLPRDATINLIISNETLQKNYILKKGNVSRGIAENPDMILSLPLKYVNEFTEQNFCTVIQNVNKNEDLGMDTKLSVTRLLIKYRSMLKYKSCLGF
ncbi:MAG: hypothetical protein Q8N88_05590 [Nanoarchaeota archaeon]|nr:hypothetical protein [Nanoarchaeota archaeon]